MPDSFEKLTTASASGSGASVAGALVVVVVVVSGAFVVVVSGAFVVVVVVVVVSGVDVSVLDSLVVVSASDETSDVVLLSVILLSGEGRLTSLLLQEVSKRADNKSNAKILFFID